MPSGYVPRLTDGFSCFSTWYDDVFLHDGGRVKEQKWHCDRFLCADLLRR